MPNEQKKEEVIEPQVVSGEGGALINISPQGLDVKREVERIERDIELYNKVKTIALRLTKPSDWLDMGGSPYLQDRGAENIGVAFGVDISDTSLGQQWDEDKKGRYYTFVAKGKAYSRKLERLVEDIGTCSQRDKFFGYDSVAKEWRPAEDVDMTNIRKKAMTNLYTRLIKRVVGMTNVTMDDLKASGMDISKIKRVEYAGGGKRNEATMSDEGKAKRTELGDMLLQMASGDRDAAAKLLEKYSSWTSTEEKGGKSVKVEHKASSLNQLTEKWLNKVYDKVKADWDKVGKSDREPGQEG